MRFLTSQYNRAQQHCRVASADAGQDFFLTCFDKSFRVSLSHGRKVVYATWQFGTPLNLQLLHGRSNVGDLFYSSVGYRQSYSIHLHAVHTSTITTRNVKSNGRISPYKVWVSSSAQWVSTASSKSHQE